MEGELLAIDNDIHPLMSYSLLWGVLIISLLLLAQGAQGLSRLTNGVGFAHEISPVGNNLFLGFWTSESIAGFSQNNYMTLYSALGVAQAVMTFGVSLAFRYIHHNLFQTLPLNGQT